MGFVIKEQGSNIQPVPEGVHPGVCQAVYDLGTHYQEKFDKRVHQLLIVWELPEERIEVERDGQKLNLPRVVSKKYTVSLHEKALLRKHLQGWRGRAFTEEEKAGFDVTKLLGVNCLIQIIHNSSDGKIYANIENILPLPKTYKKYEPENQPVYFTLQERMDIPKTTPEWVKEIITESEEWTNQAGEETQVPPQEEDDVPF